MYSEEILLIWVNRRLFRLTCRDIILFEAEDNYIKVHTTDSKVPYLVRLTMKQAERMLPGCLFIRVHRSYIIGLYHVRHFTRDTVHIGTREVPLAPKYAQGLHDRFVVLGVFWGKSK